MFLSACGGGGGGGGGNTGGSNTGGGGGNYTVSVTTSGLTGSGLQVGLSSDAGVDTLSITSNGTRNFSLTLPAGSVYSIGIGNQPSGQSCSIGGNFFGTSISSNVTATVTCVGVASVGGTISGLSGSVTLRLNGSNSTTFTSNGSFVFSNQIAFGSYYAVEVATQPVGQVCLVSNSGGQIGTGNISDVVVSCSTSPGGYRVGGYINGFSGLAVLSLNGTEELSRTYNGSFMFSTPLASDTPYTVSVSSITAGYECSVLNGNGVIADSDFPFIDITCQQTPASGIRPKVDPDGAWLDTGETITLTLNGSEDMTLDDWDWNPVAFTTQLNPGDTYEVTVTTPPAGEYCVLYNSVGVIEAGVTPLITIDCATDTPAYSIGGSITGLTGSGLELSLDGRDYLTIGSTDTSYVFPDLQPNYTTHYVTVKTHPAGQICSVTNDSAWISSSNISDASIICSPGPYSIGGYAAGVTATGLSLQLNNAETIAVPSGGSFVFNTLFSAGMDYQVEIVSQPTDQQCVLEGGSGANIATSVSNIIVDCRNVDYSVSAHVAGYSSSTPLMLQLNGTEIIEVSNNTTVYGILNPVPFETRLSDGDSYNVAIAGQPAGQICSLTNTTGTINASDVTNVGAYCVSESASAGPYTVSVTTSGLLGSGLVLQLNGANNLAVSSDGYTTFATTLTDTSAYSVAVLTQPSSPIQYCDVVNGSGTIAAANVTNVSVQCGNGVLSLYPVNGKKWLDYVKNDGANTYSATDTACDPTVDTGGYNTCLNGGEFMVVSVPALANCTNVTASDNLNAFNWICDDSSGVRLISTGLNSSAVALTGLIDFDAAEFKANFVTIKDNGVTVDQTQSAVWWENPVQINNTGDYLSSGQITLVTGSVPGNYDMVNNSALLIKPGYALAGAVSVDTIFNSDRKFLWFEGDINGATGDGLYWPFSARFSVLLNAQISNNGGSGVVIYGDDNYVANVTANNNGTRGISLSGSNLLIDNLTASNNLGYRGISISTGNSNVSNITASGNSNGTGFYLNTSGNVTLSDVTAENNGTAVVNSTGIQIAGDWANYVGPHTFTNLSANGNGQTGIYVEGVKDSSFTNISANNNVFRGIDIWEASNSPLVNLSAAGNGDIGMRIYRWDNSKGEQWTAANNGLDGVVLGQTDVFTLNQLVANNNGQYGYFVDASSRIVSINVTTTNNVNSGIAQLGGSSNSWNNILIGGTSVNNGGHGFEITRMSQQSFSSVLALNNSGNGITTYIFVDNVTMSNVVSANNTGYGFEVGSNYGYYTGLLEMGNNGLGDCLDGAGIITDPGLQQHQVNPNNWTNDCDLQGTSDGTLITGVDSSSSIIGKVTSNDTTNGDDDLSPGTAAFNSISDWFGFDNAWRSWGVDGSAYANGDNQGACTSGNTCRIWDWSAATADAGNSGSAAIYNVVALPTASDVLTMDWTNSQVNSQAYCDTNFPGSVWDGGTSCIRTYLRHAQEIMGDNIGNDNGLCENGETCLYMPNIGSYQGHGSLVSAGTVGTGADTITLMKYQNLGR